MSLNLVWQKQGFLITPRCYHTADLLNTNKILIAGGQGGMNKCELYDVATGLFSTTDSMQDARFYHTTVELNDNKILIIGGTTGLNDTLNTCEIYDPATELWAATGSMNYNRYYHTATVLSDGTVLVAGGYGYSDKQKESGTYLTSCEIYNPATGVWTETGSMNVARNQHGAEILADGTVLVAGGINKNFYSDFESLNSVEIYDPATEVWTSVSNMNYKRDNVNLFLLPNNTVFVSNGSSGWDRSYANKCEIYDPTTDTWTLTGTMKYNRHYHVAELLNNETIIAVGGYDYGTTGGVVAYNELYDIDSNTWSIAQSIGKATTFHTVTNIGNSDILVLGGLNGGYNDTSEIFYTVDYDPGVYKVKVNGYFADNVNYFATGSVLSQGPVTSFEIDTVGAEDFKSIEWKGYFKPNYTGTHTFYLASDDASYLWIGDSALSGYTTENALVNNGGLHGVVTVSATISLTAGIYYPIRVQYGENAGGATMQVSYSHLTQAQTQIFTGLLFYNDDTNGF